jgi:hypothetical protein
MYDEPVRCIIVDVDLDPFEVVPGLLATTPDISRPHIGKLGIAEKDGINTKITLDDGTILMGYECWWEPVKEPQ